MMMIVIVLAMMIQTLTPQPLTMTTVIPMMTTTQTLVRIMTTIQTPILEMMMTMIPSYRGGSPWVYEDGSTGLGPVPTASGDGTAPVDPDGVSFQGFAEAMEALVQNEFQKEAFEIQEEFANK